MKSDLFLVFILSLLIICNPSYALIEKEKIPKIPVFFEIYEKDIDISNSFSVEFISNGQSCFGFVKGSQLTLPKLPKNIEFVSVIFKYGAYELHFPKVGLDLIHYRGKIKWVFRIDYPPFNETRFEDIEVNKPSKICYFQFSPDKGSAIEVMEPIYEK